MAVTRRTVLKWTGIGLGSAAVAAAVGVTARGAFNGAFNSGSGDPYELWRTWPSLTGTDRIVGAGILACNPHNTQPWMVDIDGDVIFVRADAARRMPANDAIAREHFAGLGCAIENMVIASRAEGVPATVDLFPDGAVSDLVATIALGTTGARQDEALAAAIPDRHTNRGPYTPAPVETAELDRLAGDPSDIGSSRVLWVTDEPGRADLGALYVEATEAIINDREASEEAFAWFRNDRADIDANRDGLTLDCQGLSELTLFMAKVLPAQSREEGDRFWLTSTRDVHTATAAAYGVVTVDDVEDRAAQVSGGRLLARLHLGATAAGLGFHHMNQITERIDRDAATGAPDVFSDRWSSIIGVPALQGMVSFRVGHPERAAGLSPRRPVADVVRS